MAAGFLKSKVMDNKEAIEILNITCGKRLYVTDNKEEERKS